MQAFHESLKAKERYDEGLRSLGAGQFSQAARLLGEVITFTPEHRDARAALCLAYHELGDSAKLLDTFEGLSALDSADAERVFVMAVAYYAAGDYRAARRNIHRSLRLRLDWALAHYARGRILLALRRYQTAPLAFECALQLDPNFQLARPLLEWVLSYLSLDAGKRRLRVTQGVKRLHEVPFDLDQLDLPKRIKERVFPPYAQASRRSEP